MGKRFGFSAAKSSKSPFSYFEKPAKIAGNVIEMTDRLHTNTPISRRRFLKASAASMPLFYAVSSGVARANDKEAAQMIPEFILDPTWPPRPGRL